MGGAETRAWSEKGGGGGHYEDNKDKDTTYEDESDVRESLLSYLFINFIYLFCLFIHFIYLSNYLL